MMICYELLQDIIHKFTCIKHYLTDKRRRLLFFPLTDKVSNHIGGVRGLETLNICNISHFMDEKL